MIWAGGGRLIFGIPILLVENDPLQLFRQTADFGFAPGALQTIQANMKGLPGRVEGGSRGGGGVATAILGFRPTRLHRVSGTFATLLRCQPGSASRTALFPASASKSNGGSVFPLSHNSIVRERSRRHCEHSIRGGGGRGIRTPGTLSSSTVFKTAGFNHSPIPPLLS
jgi:hypothetical protein